jgi:drug/metabolite transporter (DMT)-like permease
MPATALALALSAAVLHAFWNVLLARARDTEAATAVMLLVALVAYAPVAAATWRFEREVIPFVVVTGLLQLAYVALLAAAYRRAELSVVYPISRGAAPVLVLVVGGAALGATTSVRQAAGVCLVGLGVLLVRGLKGGADRVGLVFGLVIAAVIAGYTLLDKRGVEHAAPFVYLELSMLVPGIGYTAALAARRGLRIFAAEARPSAALAGLATFGAYGLVLAALQRAPAAPVAAVRETSIVIATAFAALVLREQVGPERLVGAVLVAGGVVLVSL